jgi:hypothetical protein
MPMRLFTLLMLLQSGTGRELRISAEKLLQLFWSAGKTGVGFTAPISAPRIRKAYVAAVRTGRELRISAEKLLQLFWSAAKTGVGFTAPISAPRIRKLKRAHFGSGRDQ